MASFGTGRVNVSQYLRNLNVQGPSVEETLTDEDLEKDLALFTNTQFFDFETGQHTDYQAPPVKPEVTKSPAEDATSTDPIIGDFAAGYDFPIAGDFDFGDYTGNFTSSTIPTFPNDLGTLPPVQPGPQTAYPSPISPHHQQPSAPGGPHASVAPVPHAPPTNGRALSFEDASRLAAEEDKRKRNTAASARFRIKKKQREQELEKRTKEMSDKVTMLEGRISALETENKWLKSLVTEKHGGCEDILQKLLNEVVAQETGKEGGDSGSAKKD
ncbi:hypothetical protein N658DRAFT_485747 [Parathielavia hyrcaniae]|uniref:BZIP domain-containing protein n=1 Tax=Parathielavia hyrcaniae TaxID=113614 RepID=A0AAN6Q426_9PEZI|nr:hypothetical protein N658DRAFT_485747 [Parathielavia hyrcaniae]